MKKKRSGIFPDGGCCVSNKPSSCLTSVTFYRFHIRCTVASHRNMLLRKKALFGEFQIDFILWHVTCFFYRQRARAGRGADLMPKVDLITKSWWSCWRGRSRHRNGSLSSSKPPNSRFIPPQSGQTETFSEIFQCGFFLLAWLECTSAPRLRPMSVTAACEPAYRDIASAGDCASILAVMCFCEMARKKTPNRTGREKGRKERNSSNTLLFPCRCDSEWIKKKKKKARVLKLIRKLSSWFPFMQIKCCYRGFQG